MKITKLGFIAILTAFFAFSSIDKALACACGCALFDVSTSSLIPSKKGGLAFFEYDYVSQGQNWHGTKSAASDDNEDKNITTQIMTAGLQYNFNRDWGLTMRIPYVDRQVKMVSKGDMGMEMVMKSSDRLLGDVRLTTNYSGLSADMSTGLIFGVKLPTGKYDSTKFDARDMQIGTGSTDSILGAYHLGKLTDDGVVGYFVQGTWQKPIMTVKDYRPGDEENIALGAYYDFGRVGAFSKVSPLLQLIASNKSSDKGANADILNSGYSRVLLSPGIELDIKQFKFYADVELPIYNNVKGNQLAVEQIFKFIIGYKF